MRPLRYSINVTLDGYCSHEENMSDEESHRYSTEAISRADALIFGRTTYELMEAAFRPPGMLDEMPDWTRPFAETIDSAKKYVVSSTLDQVDWNSELLRGDLEEEILKLKREPGEGLFTGGLQLPMALAEMGLIDDYEFVVWPRLIGHGPYLFDGLSKIVDLEPVDRTEYRSGAVATRYVPRSA